MRTLLTTYNRKEVLQILRTYWPSGRGRTGENLASGHEVWIELVWVSESWPRGKYLIEHFIRRPPIFLFLIFLFQWTRVCLFACFPMKIDIVCSVQLARVLTHQRWGITLTLSCGPHEFSSSAVDNRTRVKTNITRLKVNGKLRSNLTPNRYWELST